MKVEYINPFFSATNQVFKNMLQLDVEKGEMKANPNSLSDKEANVSIGVKGDLKGKIVFSFPKDMALSIVTEMAGMEMGDLNTFVTSAVGELANIISGHAMTDLHSQNIDCDINPPEFIIGRDQTINTDQGRMLVIPLKTKLGQFDLNIAIGDEDSE